jgi:iron complex outermembrane receptor protein
MRLVIRVRAARCAGLGLAALGFVLGAAASSAQEAFRQTVVVTASATPVELGSVTRTMTVITREQIASLPASSVADVLRLAASVDVRARGVRGVQSDFAVRGATFGQMLVLVDGVRLNDAQSGHHNGDIPVPLDAVERIEVLYGPGSSIFGADAFGGTVNVITRQSVTPSLVLEAGSFGYGSGRAQAGFSRGGVSQTLSVSADRSSGFIDDRDFGTRIARSRTSFADGTTVGVSFLWKEFGALNFYGGNVPSREWTNQTLVSAERPLGTAAGWTLRARASYRTHGDRFLYDTTRPLLSDNRHRTHAGLGAVTASRKTAAGATLTAGVEGGREWIRSSNLGDRTLGRISGFGEWRQAFSPRLQVDASMRLDGYEQFGTSWNPSAGVSWWPVARLRLRTSVARAFRVPTFTERYYTDPSNLARADIGPESSWSREGGADLFLPGQWVVHAAVFSRVDTDVIDWLRPDATVRWQTYNVRDVDTRGVEVGVRRAFAGGAFVQADYTGLDLDASAVDQLSKYVLEYAPRAFTAAASVPLPWKLRVAPRLEYKRRTRPGVSQDYVLLDTRVGRTFGRQYALFVEGTNLFDARYQEVAGVVMPGAAMTVSLSIGTR